MAYTHDPDKLIRQLRTDLARSNQTAIDLRAKLDDALTSCSMLTQERNKLAAELSQWRFGGRVICYGGEPNDGC